MVISCYPAGDQLKHKVSFNYPPDNGNSILYLKADFFYLPTAIYCSGVPQLLKTFLGTMEKKELSYLV